MFNNMKSTSIINISPLGFPWATQDPFLFCVHHEDFYPEGNNSLGPNESLSGRNLGSDFTIKDGYRMYHGRTVPGFPAHPHRGFETVTIVRKGLVDHSDSMGAAGRFGNGDVQWMTAGKGVQHSEMFPLLNKTEKNPFELFQIWINLPKADKFAEPHFKMLWNEGLQTEYFTDQNGHKSEITVVTGDITKVNETPPPNSWASRKENNVAIWNIKMAPNAELKLPIADEKANRNLYFFKGENITIDDKEIDSYKGIELRSELETVIINGSQESHLLLLQGNPIGEPVVQYGPFVMNSNEEVQQAMIDFQNTQFGGWPWPKSDNTHDAQKGRFAKHADGRLEEKS